MSRAPVVHGRGRADRHLADADLVADVDLAHIGEAPHQPAGAHGHHEGHVSFEQPQRRQVEMVEVDVGDERGVDPLEVGLCRAARAA